jgi:hypothetical protein
LQLKAFYVDLLVPLETNLEKDTKVIQVIKRTFLKTILNTYLKSEPPRPFIERAEEILAAA